MCRPRAKGPPSKTTTDLFHRAILQGRHARFLERAAPFEFPAAFIEMLKEPLAEAAPSGASLRPCGLSQGRG